MQIRLKKTIDGFNVINVVKLLVASTNLTLLEAKQACESLLDGNIVLIDVQPDSRANDLLSDLAACHVDAQVDSTSG
jgi:hypothetical protein